MASTGGYRQEAFADSPASERSAGVVDMSSPIEENSEGQASGRGGYHWINKTNSCQKVGTFSNQGDVTVASFRHHPSGLPEVCVIGRTNAGKSSLLNHLR